MAIETKSRFEMDYVTSLPFSKAHEIGERAYVALLSFWVLAGLAVTALGSYLTYGIQMPVWVSILLCITTFIGVFVAKKDSSSPRMLLGYALMAVPFGLLLGPTLAMHTKANVVYVLGLTTVITIGLSGVGVIYPNLLKGFGIVLFGGLLFLILGMFATLILGAFGLPIKAAMTGWDWLGVFLFSALIVYDMGAAVRDSHTKENCLWYAVSLYLNVLNLFLRLLNLKGSD